MNCLKCYSQNLEMQGSGSDGQFPTQSWKCRDCGAVMRYQLVKDADDSWYEKINAKARALTAHKKDRMPGRYRS